jgi:DNA-binding response OmpR family regulator
MSKRVVILEDDPGYESLLRSVADSRGWQVVIGAAYDDLVDSIDWADVAIVDLDVVGAADALAAIRDREIHVPTVVVASDTAVTAESTGADAVIHQLPVGLVDAVDDVAAPPVVIDLSDRVAKKAAALRPWYATS